VLEILGRLDIQVSMPFLAERNDGLVEER